MKPYTFEELYQYWQRGAFTLDEMIEQIMQTMTQFRNRSNRLDYKLIPFQAEDEVPPDDTDIMEAEAIGMLKALRHDERVAYRLIDYILDRCIKLEHQLIKLERDYDTLARKMDQTLFLN